LDKDVEGRTAFERHGASVVDVNGEEESEEPGKDAGAGMGPKKEEKRDLRDCDLPA